MPDKPNIVLILSDQHRGDTMGCAGHPVVKTPNLDRLAAEGVNFGRCYTTSPVCVPARVSLANGKYVNQHGVWINDIALDCHGPSHVRNIRDSGYHTAIIGKTHLISQKNVKHLKECTEELKNWGYQDVHELGGIPGKFGTEFTDYLEEKGLFDIYASYMKLYGKGFVSGKLHPWEQPPCLVPTEDTVDIYNARESAEWIRGYKDDKPFYLQVGFNGPHDPFDSPAEYRDMYKPEDMPLAIMDEPKPPVPSYVKTILKLSALDGMTECHNRVMRTYYYGKVSLVDHGIGMVIKALEDRGMLDNTWIIYTSDHGEMLGDHRLNHKVVFYEGAVHVPCIARPAGGCEGWKSNGLGDLLDITATLLDIGGAEPFEESSGCSLVPKIRAGADAPDAQEGKEAVYSEVVGFSMVRTERYKMAVISRTRKPVELYDLENDPSELHNLVEDPAMEEVRNELMENYLEPFLKDMDEEKLTAFEEKKNLIANIPLPER